MEFVGETVDLWLSFVLLFFSFMDGEAGVRKTAVLMISPSVKDPQKDFFVKDFLGKYGFLRLGEWHKGTQVHC